MAVGWSIRQSAKFSGYTVCCVPYGQFMEYLADGNIDLVCVCVSKSKLTFWEMNLVNY